MLKVKIIEELQPYLPIWQAMRDFTDQRALNPSLHTNEIWVLEHNPVFTQGQAGKPEHLINPHDIPVIQTDRGGQITYHGPGQLIIYPLLDINALGLNTRDYVRILEKCIIEYLQSLDIKAENKIDAPGVYVNDAKICSIGLRVRKGLSYHGLAFNIDMDLKPFSYINPCGFKELKITQLSDFKQLTVNQVIEKLIPNMVNTLNDGIIKND